MANTVASVMLPEVYKQWLYKMTREGSGYAIWAWPAETTEDVKMPETGGGAAQGNVRYIYALSPTGDWPSPYDLDNFKFFLRASLSSSINTELGVMGECGWLPVKRTP
jgi:hypothetical protein